MEALMKVAMALSTEINKLDGEGHFLTSSKLCFLNFQDKITLRFWQYEFQL